MKCVRLFLLCTVMMLMTANAVGQTTFNVRFSKLIGIQSFLQNLSEFAPPNNPYRKAYEASRYNTDKYNKILAGLQEINTDYEYEFKDYGGDKNTGSTYLLLSKELADSKTVAEFRRNATGIIPNTSLFVFADALEAFEPIYDELIYQPCKPKFDTQLKEIEAAIARVDMGKFLRQGMTFYGSTWNPSLPFELVFHPQPGGGGFMATAFFNYGVSAVPQEGTDLNAILSVIFHELFHILYDEQPPQLKRSIYEWRDANLSRSSHYAFTLLNEGLATALGNGYVASHLNGKLNEGNWYGRKQISSMAKQMYPIVLDYLEKGRTMDKAFLDAWIKAFDENYTEWLTDPHFILMGRYVLADDPTVAPALRRKFPWMQQITSVVGITESEAKELAAWKGSKVVVITKDHAAKLAILRNAFPELKDWKPDAGSDFTFSRLLTDKSYLIVINAVNLPLEKQLEGLTLTKD